MAVKSVLGIGFDGECLSKGRGEGVGELIINSFGGIKFDPEPWEEMLGMIGTQIIMIGHD